MTSARLRRAALRGLLACFCCSAASPRAAHARPAGVARPPSAAAGRTPKQAGQAGQQAERGDAHFAPFTRYYGLYVGGQKAGWMRASLTYAPLPQLAFDLQAKVAGMGREAKVTLSETRAFAKDGKLVALTFEQRSDTGAVRVHGRRKGAAMALTVEAGGAQQTVTVATDEHLADDMAVVTLARRYAAGKDRVGARIVAHHLDPASQQVVTAESTLTAAHDVTLSGVTEKALQVTTRYPALKVEESTQLDLHGAMLQARVGGLFEARLEDEALAKQPGTVQDVLMGAVVKPPRPLENVAAAPALKLTFAGLGPHDDLPAADRQRVARTPQGLQLTLTREAPPQAAYCAPWAKSATPTPCPAAPTTPQVRQNLAPSPFIQSQAPELVAMARRAVGETHDVHEAITRLCAAVKNHLHAEYVPAFSNALEAYHSGRGDCTEHSVLFAALARAAGIPARPVVGIAYWPPGGGFGWHAWDEVFVAGRWLQVDPTWDQPVADVTHVKLAEGGPAEQASVVMLLGRLQLVDWQVVAP